jgi:putative DNA primase/helicase
MTKKAEGHPTELADLFGKRLVIAIETAEGGRLDEVRIKELTGGDSVRARRMREDFWEFKPTHTLIMATNHKPVVRGTDMAIWRRLKLIPFTVTMADADADVAMPEKLKAELPGILSWCVRGCLAWQARGLDAPEEVTEATTTYRREQDVLGLFLAERTLKDTNYRVKAGELYAEYKTWAENGSERVMTNTAFALALNELGFKKVKSSGNWYIGLGLRNSQDTETGHF